MYPFSRRSTGSDQSSLSKAAEPSVQPVISNEPEEANNSAELSAEEAAFTERCKNLAMWNHKLSKAKRKISKAKAEMEEAERMLAQFAMNDRLESSASSGVSIGSDASTTNDLEVAFDRKGSVSSTSSNHSRFWLL
mmetsp:Transcript_27234/g.55597  ORF Transcript_27234/g.55597 Transcript_27234/m.55597 type:complete len:136 (-) Transcript_27234:149-556(-)